MENPHILEMCFTLLNFKQNEEGFGGTIYQVPTWVWRGISILNIASIIIKPLLRFDRHERHNPSKSSSQFIFTQFLKSSM